MSYNRDLETNRDAKRQSDLNLKKAAAERLAKIAARKKATKKGKEDEQ